MLKNNKLPKKKNQGPILLIMFIIITLMGVLLSLVSSGIIPGKKASDGIMWFATAFCYVIGVPGLYISIMTIVKEKIARKRFRKIGRNEEDDVPEELSTFINAIPGLKTRDLLDVSDKTMKHYVFKQVKRSIVKFELFDDDNNLIYNSYRLNKTFFVPLKVAFNNHISNKTYTHIIGRVLVGNGDQNMYFMKTPCSFRTDGLTIDDYCRMLNIKMIATGENQYDIRYKNALISHIRWIKTKRLVQPSKKVDPIEIDCIEEYLDIAFFLCFAYGFCGRDISTKYDVHDVTSYGRM